MPTQSSNDGIDNGRPVQAKIQKAQKPKTSQAKCVSRNAEWRISCRPWILFVVDYPPMWLPVLQEESRIEAAKWMASQVVDGRWDV